MRSMRLPGIHETISKDDYKNEFERFYQLSPSFS